jgi:hypothetical protein
VDASVRANVEQHLQQTQTAQETGKRWTTNTRWGFQHTNQVPATQFWPGRVPAPGPVAPTKAKGQSIPDSSPWQLGMSPRAAAVLADHDADSATTPMPAESASGRYDRQESFSAHSPFDNPQTDSIKTRPRYAAIPAPPRSSEWWSFKTVQPKDWGQTGGFSALSLSWDRPEGVSLSPGNQRMKKSRGLKVSPAAKREVLTREEGQH